jgi:hypothetical protein
MTMIYNHYKNNKKIKHWYNENSSSASSTLYSKQNTTKINGTGNQISKSQHHTIIW